MAKQNLNKAIMSAKYKYTDILEQVFEKHNTSAAWHSQTKVTLFPEDS